MPKDPAFLFYYKDYMHGTRKFTRADKGAYVDCLCEQADSGYLTKAEIKSICGRKQTFDKVLTKFRQEFDTDLGHDIYFNERLRVEQIKRSKYVKSRLENLNKGEDNVKK